MAKLLGPDFISLQVRNLSLVRFHQDVESRSISLLSGEDQCRLGERFH